jgi:hypothetical protein
MRQADTYFRLYSTTMIQRSLVGAIVMIWIVSLLFNDCRIMALRMSAAPLSSSCKFDTATTICPPTVFRTMRTETNAVDATTIVDYCAKIDYKRRVVCGTAFISTIMLCVGKATTDVAMALQPRNEPLCSTGLFENFMEYKCTPIGDIQDEGIGKDLTSIEIETTDSLLSKLGITTEVPVDIADKAMLPKVIDEFRTPIGGTDSIEQQNK